MADPTAADQTLLTLAKIAIAGLVTAIVGLWRHSVAQAKERIAALDLALETERAERIRDRETATQREAQIRAWYEGQLERVENELSAANETIVHLYSERATRAEAMRDEAIARKAAIDSRRPMSSPLGSGATPAKTPPSNTLPRLRPQPRLPSKGTR